MERKNIKKASALAERIERIGGTITSLKKRSSFDIDVPGYYVTICSKCDADDVDNDLTDLSVTDFETVKTILLKFLECRKSKLEKQLEVLL